MYFKFMNLNVFELFTQLRSGIFNKVITIHDDIGASSDGSTEEPQYSFPAGKCLNKCNTTSSTSYKLNDSGNCEYKNNVYIYKKKAKEDDEYDEELHEMKIDNDKSWKECSIEGGQCKCPNGNVYYGKGKFFSKPRRGTQNCNNKTFGDPYTFVQKKCYCDENILDAPEFNDKINSIRLPPMSYISYFEHGINLKGEGQCFNMRNNTDTSKRTNVNKNAIGKVTDIRYGKTCEERPLNGQGTPPSPPPPPRPPPPPPRPPPAIPPPPPPTTKWGKWSNQINFDNGWSWEWAWRNNAWQVVRQQDGQEYVMIIHDTKLVYAGFGDNKGATEFVEVTNKNNSKQVRQYQRLGPSGEPDNDIHLGWVNNNKSNTYFNGPFFTNTSYDHWTLKGPSYHFRYRDGTKP